MSLVNMIVPYGAGSQQAPPLSGERLTGRPFWHGGDPDPGEYGRGEHGAYRREVLVPPGRCVYYWLGCELTPEVGNLCQRCHERDRTEDAIVDEQLHQAYLKRKREKMRRYYAADPDHHRELQRARRARARAAA
jgi:hypothetical protein